MSELCVETTHRLGAQRGELMVTVAEHPIDHRMIVRGNLAQPSSAQRSAAIAVDGASFGSFFEDFSDPNTRTRADSLGGTSTTCSPAATSC
ncbi:MAG: hypothetical protein NVS3B21_20880 [Acidimicrobiales bacterium]